jgi:2-polyprenyl-6-methoxyphenol hydroxylase-like FAD-dependent oxidoreductase
MSVPWYDVVIVGAGPAGAATAVLVGRAARNLAILLVDAAVQPRFRPCGEFLAPPGVRVLHATGALPAVLADGAWPLEGVDLIAGRATVARHFTRAPHAPLEGRGLGVRRESLDLRLQNAAGDYAEFRRATALRDAVREGPGWRLDLTGDDGGAVACALLIGADGRTSRVRRLAGLDQPVARRRQALACRVERWSPRPGLPHRAEMRVNPLGQIGIAPLGPDTANLNLLLSTPAAALLAHRRPADLMRAALAADPDLAPRARSAVLGPVLASGPLTHQATARADAGVALVGDAAGTFDPVTGDGITLALLGAERLAQILATMPWKPPIAAARLAPYRDAAHPGAAAQPIRAAILHHLLARHALCAAAIAAAARLDPGARLLRLLVPG